MQDEFIALQRLGTWSLVPFQPDMKIVSNKWIFRVKRLLAGSVDRYKARLVAKGFQQVPGLDFLDTYSPVVKASTIRVIFRLAATKN